ncbi:Acyl-[acyl-carrier-protein]--UDP-N-acetylglucosamine O-acyltransferase [hydrothermal vent metagenome]|uniref:Acyl-[acyl-carrier-protein]--UDP-N-acetylglucosamine O-acyltransferase n=1 Tax=hydrothermal vent metagenome TaxID=652676 RepID=A0A3B1EA68_9ZZZZ
MINIHETAIIKDGAIIGSDVTIGAFTIIGGGVTIGNGTTVGSHTLIDGKTTIGENNRIFSHAVLGTIPQDLKFDGEETQLLIGDNNTIREHTLLNTGTSGGRYKTIIGNNSLLMGHVHIGHDCILADNIVIANSCAIAGHVTIDNNCVIGGMSAIHQFCQIGEQAMIGGGSILVQDMPPFCICEGNRAILRSLNINGLRRRFKNNRSDIDAIKKAYKDIFDSGLPIVDISHEILKKSDNIYARQLASFVITSKRGIPFTRKEQ